jgi:hypothetical protein
MKKICLALAFGLLALPALAQYGTLDSTGLPGLSGAATPIEYGFTPPPPPAPATQACADGSVILATDVCPVSPPPAPAPVTPPPAEIMCDFASTISKIPVLGTVLWPIPFPISPLALPTFRGYSPVHVTRVEVTDNGFSEGQASYTGVAYVVSEPGITMNLCFD